MILVVAKYPDGVSSREGMMKRVEAIDELFADEERVYLDVSYRPLFSPVTRTVSGQVTVVRAHFLLHLPLILRLARRSRLVYVHSLYNACRVLPLYFRARVATDLHGLVPEEEFMQGKLWKARVHNLLERVVLKKSHALLAVSHGMKRHYRAKYGELKGRFLYLPIFECEKGGFTPGDKEQPARRVALYSGGLQRWQNVDMMLAAVARQREKFEFQIFTGDPAGFEALLEEAQLRDSVFLASLSREELNGYYRKAQFGFILRDRDPVNSAACPTKLIEYINYGIVPVVLQPEVGDFAELGYRFVLLNDFIEGRIPPDGELKAMAAQNLKVLEEMRRKVADGMAGVKELCQGG